MSHKQPPSAEKVVFSLITLRLLTGQQAAAAGPINPSFGHICLPGLMADVSPLSARYFYFNFYPRHVVNRCFAAEVHDLTCTKNIS